MKKFLLILVSIIMALLLYFNIQSQDLVKVEKEGPHPLMTMILANGEKVQIELYPDEAPNTVNNIINLIQEHYYDGLVFNKILPYLVQTGDVRGNGTGYPGYFIRSECAKNGFSNGLSFEKGVVCMSRGAKYNTEGAQFFILLEDRNDLKGNYAAFGKVIEGVNVLEQLSQEVNSIPLDELQEKWRIKQIEVETFGQRYNEPEVLSLSEVKESR